MVGGREGGEKEEMRLNSSLLAGEPWHLLDSCVKDVQIVQTVHIIDTVLLPYSADVLRGGDILIPAAWAPGGGVEF